LKLAEPRFLLPARREIQFGNQGVARWPFRLLRRHDCQTQLAETAHGETHHLVFAGFSAAGRYERGRDLFFT
jgi:hypothetical protein